MDRATNSASLGVAFLLGAVVFSNLGSLFEMPALAGGILGFGSMALVSK